MGQSAPVPLGTFWRIQSFMFTSVKQLCVMQGCQTSNYYFNPREHYAALHAAVESILFL